MVTENKWKMFKNYMHSELNISREDIQAWIRDAVEEVAERLVKQQYGKCDIEKMIGEQVNNTLINAGYWNTGQFKKEVMEECSKFIASRLDIRIKHEV